jgi:hypothetical protein
MAGRIPLRGRGGIVRGWVLVDVADVEYLGEWRWSFQSQGYAARREGSSRRPGSYLVLMHRQLLGLERGDDRQADHINRDRLDNRRENLRIVTASQNAQNQGSRGRSSYRGVWWASNIGRWAAEVMLDGRKYSLGYFDDEETAARIASDFRALHMPYSDDARKAA